MINEFDELKNVTLGSYDCDKFIVLLGLNRNPDNRQITYIHEAMHHYLNISTNYGMLLNTVASEIKTNSKQQDARLLDWLINNGRFVHEVMATYTSLIVTQKTDQIVNYPIEYQNYFNFAEKIASKIFDDIFYKQMYIMSICRLAMMNNILMKCIEKGDYSYEFLKRELKPSDYPDTRLYLIKDYLLDVPSDEFYQLLIKYSGDYSKHIDFHKSSHIPKRITEDDNFDYIMEYSFTNALIELLTSLIPDLSSCDSYGRFFRLESKNSYVYRYIFNCKYTHKGDETAYYQVLAMCQQTVKYLNIPRLYISKFKNDIDNLNEIISYSINSIGKLYFFTRRSSNTIDTYILGTKIEANMRLYLLDNTELTSINQYFRSTIIWSDDGEVTLTNIIEWSDYVSLSKFKNEELLVSNLNIHIDIKIIDFIEKYLNRHRKVSWTNANVSFSNFPIKFSDGLSTCFFKIDDLPYIFFFIANDVIIMALSTYTENFINDPNIIEFISADSEKNFIDSIMVESILSHPIFKFYMFGFSPKDYI